MSRLRGDQGGHTLIELLVSLAVGSILLLAIFGALDYSVKANGKVEDRVDSSQRGRAFMELLTQQIRSQICLGPGYSPIPAGITTDGSSMTFYTDLGGDTPRIQRRTITYSNGTVFETDYDVTGTIPTAPTFTLVRQNYVLGTNLALVSGVPFFKYYAFTANPVTPNLLLGTPLLDSDKPRVVKVGISFISQSTRKNGSTVNTGTFSTFQNDVYVRTSDASDPDHSPQCI